MIKVRATEVKVRIKGGIGFVPIRFEGLASATGYSFYELTGGWKTKFDQSVNGNDFWQTDSSETGGPYQLTYNLPVDGKQESIWVLSR